ncbi:MAG: hypothetical protein KDJ77_09135 [Rhodobiaceae bacterium]|nr:hypothetical protein [Rhodobiaceae bacterium]
MSRFLLLVPLLLLACPGAATAQSGQEKQILTMTRDSWIGFRDFNGRQLVYFTHLEAWRCGIRTVRYSINDRSLDQTWELQPCDPQNPNAVTTDKPYISLAPGTAQSVSVQLTFTDGSQSPIETFKP